jgi:hypothetical protein
MILLLFTASSVTSLQQCVLAGISPAVSLVLLPAGRRVRHSPFWNLSEVSASMTSSSCRSISRPQNVVSCFWRCSSSCRMGLPDQQNTKATGRCPVAEESLSTARGGGPSCHRQASRPQEGVQLQRIHYPQPGTEDHHGFLSTITIWADHLQSVSYSFVSVRLLQSCASRAEGCVRTGRRNACGPGKQLVLGGLRR